MCVNAVCFSNSVCTAMTLYNLVCQRAGVLNVPQVVDRCGVCMGDGSSCLSSFTTCRAFGLSHYSSFSGVLFDTQSTCEMTLARDCKVAGDFDIRVRRQPDGTIDLGIAVPGNALLLYSNNTVLLNDVVFEGSVLAAGSLSVQIGSTIQVLFRNGMTLTYTPLNVALSVDSDVAPSLCGLCSATNTFTSSSSMLGFVSGNIVNGSRTGIMLSSLPTPVNTSSCSTPPFDQNSSSVCSDSMQYFSALRFCDSLSNPNNVLGGCFPSVTPTAYFTNCIMDYCLGGTDLAKLNIDAYYRRCLSRNVSNILYPFDMCGVLNGDDSSCPASIGVCSVLGDTGLFTLVRQPVAYSGLGLYDLFKTCNSDRLSMQFSRNNRTYTAGVLQSSLVIRRAGKPTIALYPSVVPYLGTYPTRADWVVADILNTTRLVVQPVFDAFGVLVNGAIADANTPVNPGALITLTLGHVLLNNNLLFNLPITMADGTSIAVSTAGIVVRLESGIVVKWTGAETSQVLVPTQYMTQTCGLCGAFDPNDAQHLLLRTGELVSASDPADQWTFGYSWLVTQPIIDPVPPTPPVVECAVPMSDVMAACSVLLDNSTAYPSCYGTVPPALYFSSCMDAVCRSDASCNSIRAYEAACIDSHVVINTVVDSCGVCFGDGTSCTSSGGSCTIWNDHVLFLGGDSLQVAGNSLDYMFAQDCAGITFSVQVRYSSVTSVLVAVAVNIERIGTVFIFSNGTVEVDSNSVTSFPITMGDGSLVEQDGLRTKVTLAGIAVVVTWDQSLNAVTLSSPQSYASRLCGLCASGVNSSHPLGPLGNLSTTQCQQNPVMCAAEIVPSWAIRPQDLVLPPLPLEPNNPIGGDACNSSAQRAAAQEYCSAIRSPTGLYAACQNVVSPTAYFSACV